MQEMGVEVRSLPYVHGHVVFSKNALSFVKEWYEACLQWYSRRELMPNYDETVLNALLCKHRVSEYLPIYVPILALSRRRRYLRLLTNSIKCFMDVKILSVRGTSSSDFRRGDDGHSIW